MDHDIGNQVIKSDRHIFKSQGAFGQGQSYPFHLARLLPTAFPLPSESLQSEEQIPPLLCNGWHDVPLTFELSIITERTYGESS